MNKKNCYHLGLQKIWKDGRDLRHNRALAPAPILLSRLMGLSMDNTCRVIVTPWSWWDRSDRKASILITAINYISIDWLSHIYLSFLLFFTLGSYFIWSIYSGPKFVTSEHHYMDNSISSADCKVRLWHQSKGQCIFLFRSEDCWSSVWFFYSKNIA